MSLQERVKLGEEAPNATEEDDEGLFEPGDDSDLGLSDGGDEHVGLDAQEGPAEGLADDDLGRAGDAEAEAEGVRWSEGSEAAGDALGAYDEFAPDDGEDGGRGPAGGSWTVGNEPADDLDAGLDEIAQIPESADLDDQGAEGFEDEAALLEDALGALPPLSGEPVTDDGAPVEGDEEGGLGLPSAAADEEPLQWQLPGGARCDALTGVHVSVDAGRQVTAAGPVAPPTSALLSRLPPTVEHGEDAALSVATSGAVPRCFAAWPGHILHALQTGADAAEPRWLPKVDCTDVRRVAADGGEALAVLCGAGVMHSVDAGEHFKQRALPPTAGEVLGLHAAGSVLLLVTATGLYGWHRTRFALLSEVVPSAVASVREGNATAVYLSVEAPASAASAPGPGGPKLGNLLLRTELMAVRRPTRVVCALPGPGAGVLRAVRAGAQTTLSAGYADGTERRVVLDFSGDDDDV